MNISTVNELIQSLESAGELSIKERKYLELAKAYQQLAAENVGLKAGIGEAYDEMEQLDDGYFSTDADGEPMDTLITLVDAQAAIQRLAIDIETHATDRIVAGIKAEGAAEREKTITFTAAKKRTQDGVALIAIGKPYKIHNDDVIGKFFIGERGRYGVITMDCLDYFTTSDEYAWEFSLREGAK
ncbi:hypothetical protein RS557_000032 [Klebsiella michiganensis]|nr:hypothetical protein [Klebsiella michiganensis]ELC2231940.1 hypothetical protein [Klebsiella michiganensis]ELJ6253904.1 hypothetical protein [Klebsiella michiganensis]